MSDFITHQDHQDDKLDHRALSKIGAWAFGGGIQAIIRKACLLAATAAHFALSSCAAPYFPSQEKPLFSGLDEMSTAPDVQTALAEAKEDFALALHNQAPVHARYVETLPYTHSKVYEGNGYRLTVVHQDMINYQKDGPQITLEPSITGGKPYTFDRIGITQI